jgi:hypothetical protein
MVIDVTRFCPGARHFKGFSHQNSIGGSSQSCQSTGTSPNGFPDQPSRLIKKGVSTMNPTQFAEATVKARDEGRVSEFAVHTVMKALAEDLAGGDMNKFLYKTDAGAVFLRPRQTRSTPGEQAELHKSEKWTKRVEREEPATKVDWSNDVEATKAYRAEKAAKASQLDREHNAQRHNAAANLYPQQDSLNPGGFRTSLGSKR